MSLAVRVHLHKIPRMCVTRARSLISWVAIMAILMAALAPAISHAMRAETQNAWLEVCSASGFRLVRVDASVDRKIPDTSAAHLLDHCPYCSLHTSAFAPPPAPLNGWLALPMAFEVPRLFLTAPRTLYAWRTSQPRAPPLFSWRFAVVPACACNARAPLSSGDSHDSCRSRFVARRLALARVPDSVSRW